MNRNNALTSPVKVNFDALVPIALIFLIIRIIHNLIIQYTYSKLFFLKSNINSYCDENHVFVNNHCLKNILAALAQHK